MMTYQWRRWKEKESFLLAVIHGIRNPIKAVRRSMKVWITQLGIFSR